MRLIASFGMTCFLALGCAQTTAVPAGGSCFRSSQCVPGHVCVSGVCSTDISSLEAGVVPDAGNMMVDAGPAIDGAVDAGPPGVDSGPPVDAGPVDAGPPMPDAGFDAGPPMMDAGFDAGPPMIDAGTDAGPPAPTDGG